MSEKICTWSQDENGLYDTECGHKFEFIYDGPSENGAVFCCYCGKKLVEERMGSACTEEKEKPNETK